MSPFQYFLEISQFLDFFVNRYIERLGTPFEQKFYTIFYIWNNSYVSKSISFKTQEKIISKRRPLVGISGIFWNFEEFSSLHRKDELGHRCLFRFLRLMRGFDAEDVEVIRKAVESGGVDAKVRQFLCLSAVYVFMFMFVIDPHH